jgi:hypothetical protein
MLFDNKCIYTCVPKWISLLYFILFLLVTGDRYPIPAYLMCVSHTSGNRAFGLDPLVPASIWAGTKGPATSPQIRQPPGRL